MKIVYLVHQFYPEWSSGTEKFVLNLALMMQKMGHSVKVITYGLHDSSSYDKESGDIVYREVIYKGIPVTAVRHRSLGDCPDLSYSLGDPRMSKVAYLLLQKEKPDLVHVGHSMRISEFIKTARALKIPYIVTLTDYFLLCPRYLLLTAQDELCSGPENGSACARSCGFSLSGMKERSLQAGEILANAQSVVSPSLFLKNVFSREMRELSVDVIGHGITYQTLRMNTKKYCERDTLKIFYGGSLIHHKGVHVLINAVKSLHGKRIELQIYGAEIDPYTERLKELIGDDKRIRLCGAYSEDDEGRILSSVDLAVVPSIWYENYPLVLHEALACNVPVVASDIGGMAEKIRDWTNGFVFRVNDPDHLGEVLKGIIENPALLNDIKDKMNTFMVPTIEQEAFAYERKYHRAIHENQAQTVSEGEGAGLGESMSVVGEPDHKNDHDKQFDIRSYRQGNEAGINDMFNEVFLHDRDIAHWYWKYRDNPYGSHYMSLAFAQDDTLAAHYAGYPVTVYFQPLRKNAPVESIALQVGDKMVRRQFRGTGFGKTALLTRTFMHFRETCERHTLFAYGFPTGHSLRFGEMFLKYTVIDKVHYRKVGLEALRHAVLKPSGGVSGQCRTLEVAVIDEDWTHFFTSVAGDYKYLVRRDAKYLNWRYLQRPDKKYLILAARRNSQLCGWAVFFREGTQIMWGDALFAKNDIESVQAVITHLLDHSLSDGAECVEAWFPPRPGWWDKMLSKVGFSLAQEPRDLRFTITLSQDERVSGQLRKYFYYTIGDSDLF